MLNFGEWWKKTQKSIETFNGIGPIAIADMRKDAHKDACRQVKLNLGRGKAALGLSYADFAHIYTYAEYLTLYPIVTARRDGHRHLRASDIALMNDKHPDGEPCDRRSWLIHGRLFNFEIAQTVDGALDGERALDTLCSAANDIAEACESFRDMDILPFILNDNESPSAIQGYQRGKDHKDIRVVLYPPFLKPRTTGTSA